MEYLPLFASALFALLGWSLHRNYTSQQAAIAKLQTENAVRKQEIGELRIAEAQHSAVWIEVKKHMDREEAKLDALHRRLDDFSQNNATAHGRIEQLIGALRAEHGERLASLETLVRNGGR